MSDAVKERFSKVVERIRNGMAVTMEEFRFHIEQQNLGVRSGPPVGERLPTFQLLDQTGRHRSIEDLAGPNGLLLVFVRTANGCGYCRNQLAELDLSLDDLRQRGIGLAAVTSDAPAITSEFSDLAGLRYPLLADTGARYIERIGIRNTNVEEHDGGINGGRFAFPGHFLLDASGVIVDKLFTDDLRHRASATTLVFRHHGEGSASTGIDIQADAFDARLVLATGRVQTGQEIAFAASFRVKPGWHLYGSPLPKGYVPLAIAFDEQLLALQEFALPAARPMRLDALGETLPVYEGDFEGQGRVRLKWSPPVHGTRFIAGVRPELEALQTQPGDYRLRGRLTYQACDDSSCGMPTSLAFELPLMIAPDTAKPSVPVFAGELRGR